MRLGIRVKLLIFAVLAWTAIFGIYGFYVYKERIKQTRRMALSTASLLSRKIIADRQFYTSTIIKKALEAGLAVGSSSSYHDNDKAVPLPAAFLKEVSESLSSVGLHMEIISPYPINPANAPKDAFQREGIERVLKGSEGRFYSFEKYDGKESLRYMTPDIATSEACVECHNKNQASPKKDYRLGDVMGGLEITMPIESEMAVAMADVWRSIGYGFIVIVTMGAAGFAFIRRVVTSPISSLVDTTKQLAQGDLTSNSEVRSNDELGDLGEQTNEVVKNLHRMIEDIRRTSYQAVDISNDVRKMSKHVLGGSSKQGGLLDSISANMEKINSSESEISRNAEELAASIEKGSASVIELGSGLNEVVENMGSLFLSVDETALSTKDMSFSIREISENLESFSSAVTQVSSSIVQINASIKEIETNAAEAYRFADDVIKDARVGMETVESTMDGIIKIKDTTHEAKVIINSLSDRIKEIVKILDVIRDVAEETNMLALNAAIIAAQSGEHGKSFSVVANEIKDLAERTSTSAMEVTEIINAVEAGSGRAVKAMERGIERVEEGVRLSINSGGGLKKIVNSAQRSTNSVREIARATGDQAKQSKNVAEATEKVADMIQRIVKATQEQAKGSESINKASECMAQIAHKVKGSTNVQAEANKQITKTMEDMSRMIVHLNVIFREHNRDTLRALESLEAIRNLSVANIEKAVETDKAVERMAELNRELVESVKRFKLKQ